MKKTRIFAVVLCVILAVVTLVACGEKTENYGLTKTLKEDEFIHEDADDFEDIENSILNHMNDFDNLEIPEPEENDSSEYDTNYPDDEDYPDNADIKEDL